MAEDKDGWELGDVWLKTVDKEGGVSYTYHRCWNVTRFLKKQFARALKEAAVTKQITEAEFLKATRDRRDQPQPTKPREAKRKPK